MALTILATIKGRISAFNILRNKSPGKDRYITSRGVQCSELVLRNMKPRIVPPTTPHIVRIVRRFSDMQLLNLRGAIFVRV